MSKLDPRIEAIRVQYGLEASDFWELPQKKGTWVAKHSALEVAAAKAGIAFDDPTIIEANSEAGIAVLSVAGSMYQRVGEKESRELRREWATGEASPKNNKNAYPWAMAEKRAKDRVILKLIGIHGLVYSEDEMSGSGIERERAAEGADEDGVIQSNPTSKQHFKTIYDDITACTTLKQLQGAWERHQPVVKVLSEEHRKMLMERKNEMKEYLSENAAAAANGQKPVNTYNFDTLETAHQ